MARPAIVCFVLLVVVSTASPTAAAEPEEWLTGLRFPVNMAWAPDGTLFYAEKETGDVRMVVDGQVAAGAVATVDVHVAFEQGLLGIAVDPGWPDEPWLYLYYSDASDGINRLIRVRVSDGREVGREVLLDLLPTAGVYHNGGELLFAPDGMLLVTVGEAHQGYRAEDPTDLGGKVLRLAPDGSIPADNPVPGTRTYTLGHRNSIGLCTDPDTGDIWETENGPSGGDEVNRLVPAANYGWPFGMGALGDERYTDPFAYFPETIVPTGCAVWRGSLYVASYGDGILRRFPLDPPRATEGRAFDFGGSVYDLSVGPDDRLYASTDDAIWRFGSAPGVSSPTEPTGPAPTGGPPWWVIGVIGVGLAISLALRLRRTDGRR